MSQVTAPSQRTLSQCTMCSAANRSTASFLLVFGLFCGAAGLVSQAFVSSASAQQIDLSLNVFYNETTNINSGGTWELVGKSSGSGIYSLQVLLANINFAINAEAPTATVNGSAGSGGLQLLGVAPILGPGNQLSHYEIAIGQIPIINTPGEQSIFYGIGTLENGSPAFAGQQGGTNSLGPTFTTLTNPNNIPWASTGDAFGDDDWDVAATLLSGTFATNAIPRFFTGGGPAAQGVVLTSVGTSNTAGSRSDFQSTTVNRLIRSNYENGDFNRNGFIDAADYTVWRDTLGTSITPGSGADGNGDGLVTGADYQIWRDLFGAGNAPNGDFNRDGFVDAADYTVWRDSLGNSLTPGTGADGNGDGLVTGADYQIWRNLFGTAAPGSLTRDLHNSTNAVPEPGTKTLVILTLLVVGAFFLRAKMSVWWLNLSLVTTHQEKTLENLSRPRRNCLTVTV